MGTFQLYCCLWRVWELSDSNKNILSCVPKMNGGLTFGTTSGWVINDIILILGWTNPLNMDIFLTLMHRFTSGSFYCPLEPCGALFIMDEYTLFCFKISTAIIKLGRVRTFFYNYICLKEEDFLTHRMAWVNHGVIFFLRWTIFLNLK